MALHDATASILQTLFGQKQLGAPAPQFQPGESGGLDLGGPDLASLLTNLGQQDQGGVTNALQALPTPPQVTELPSVFNTDEQNSALTPETSPGFLGDFFGKLDSNLQSPSKVLGLGLLNRLDPKLGLLGLLSAGIFGGNQ